MLLFLFWLMFSSLLSLGSPNQTNLYIAFAVTIFPVILIPFVSKVLLKSQTKVYYTIYKKILIEKSLLAQVLEQPEKVINQGLVSRVLGQDKLRVSKRDITIKQVYSQLSRNFNKIVDLFTVEAEIEDPSLDFKLNLVIVGVGLIFLLKGIYSVIPDAGSVLILLSIQMFISICIFFQVPNYAKKAGLRLAICDAFLE